MAERKGNGLAEAQKLRILVTNDDGVHAPGLKVLERIALALASDVWVVAPEYEQSGASHSLTLADPLRVRQISKRRFAVRGTPTDCVMMAVHKLIPNRPPDLVLSGVNRGSNLGEDVTYSGTVAAAMEGTLLRIPSIALSQQLTPGQPVKWATAEHHGPRVVARLIEAGWDPDVLINVNFPDVLHDRVNGIVVCRQGRRDLTDLVIDGRVDARGVPYYWLGFRRQKGKPKRSSDLAAVDAAAIAVTPLQLDLTEQRALKRLKAALQ